MGIFDESNNSDDPKEQEEKEGIPTFPGMTVLPPGVDEGTFKPTGPLINSTEEDE